MKLMVKGADLLCDDNKYPGSRHVQMSYSLCRLSVKLCSCPPSLGCKKKVGSSKSQLKRKGKRGGWGWGWNLFQR